MLAAFRPTQPREQGIQIFCHLDSENFILGTINVIYIKIFQESNILNTSNINKIERILKIVICWIKQRNNLSKLLINKDFDSKH